MPKPINRNNLAPIEPLSAGNVVTTALRLYRSHLKLYLGLSCKSLLWCFVPVYGWAKAAKINAIISRLAFGELIDQPETIKEIEDKLKTRFWDFFYCQFLLNIILFTLGRLVSTLIEEVLYTIITQILNIKIIFELNLNALIILLISNLVYLGVYFWLYSRWFIPELPLVIEKDMKPYLALKRSWFILELPLVIEKDMKPYLALKRSWNLTTNSALRIQLILLLGGIITLPLVLLAVIPTSFMIITGFIALQSASYSSSSFGHLILGVIFLVIFVAITNTLFTPFWQAIKAIIYYDLLSRREGIDLQLRDKKI